MYCTSSWLCASNSTLKVRTISAISIVNKRYWNRKSYRITKKQKKITMEHEMKFQNSIHKNSNYFKKPNLEVLKIPHAMKPLSNIVQQKSIKKSQSESDFENTNHYQQNMKKHPQKPLKLENEYWLHWSEVEKQLNFDQLYIDYQRMVHEIIDEQFAYEIRFNNSLEKFKVLAKVCRTFDVQIPSSDLRNINSEESIVEWLMNNERKAMMKKWHRERYMPYNLPSNMIVEVPWFYCMGEQSSAWKRPKGSRG